MTRTEVYQLRLTEQEKAQLARMAEERNISIAKLIRERVLGQSFPDKKLSAKEAGELIWKMDFGAAIHAEYEKARGVTRTINKSSTPAKANPEPADERAAEPEVPGGESGVPAAPNFDLRVKQLQRFMSKANAERVARTELGLD